MAGESLVDRVEARLAEAGIQVDVGLTAEGIFLSGTVETGYQRALAEEIAADAAEGRRIENNIDVVPPGEVAITPEPASEYEYLEEPFEQEPVMAVGSEEDETGTTTYLAPTDPVTEASEVVGGFGASSTDSLEVEPSESSATLGDEALAEAVIRELREDAATTDLQIDVTVEGGVVHLRGRVRSLEDIDSAEEVASRLAGVREVLDELELAST